MHIRVFNDRPSLGQAAAAQAAPAIQRAIDISTNGTASHIGIDVDAAITEAKFGNPTNALVAIHNANMELDDIIVLFKPTQSSN